MMHLEEQFKGVDGYENGVLSTLYIVFEIKDETLVRSDFWLLIIIQIFGIRGFMN